MRASFLEVGGELVQDAILARVEIIQELNQHTRCLVECRQTSDRRFPVEDSLGRDLKIVTFAEDGRKDAIFDGFVLEGELDYEVTGSYVVNLTAVSRSYRLELTPQERYWRKKDISEIAQALCGDDKLSVKIGSKERIQRNYVQWGETDFSFLIRLADHNGAWIRPSPDGIDIHDSFQPGITLPWRTEDGLLSFKLRGGLGQPSFSGAHYDPRTMASTVLRSVQKSAETFGSAGHMVSSVKAASAKLLPSGYVHTDERAATGEEYKSNLERESVRALASRVTGHGVSRTQAIKAGDLVTIEGNLDAAGQYGVIKVVHRWEKAGYQNEFICTPWKTWLNPVPPPPARMNGVISARVTAHFDPRKMGRVQVRYDWQEEGSTSWARMTTPHAGHDRGFMFMPEVGDEVLVAFEHGDPERPYVVGCLWNGVDHAPREEFWGADIEPNDVKRIVTRSGHRVQFSDKQGKEAITIATPDKLKISMLERSDETGRSMILVHSADGDIVFNAPNGRVHFHAKYFSREVGSSPAHRAKMKENAAKRKQAAANRSIKSPGGAKKGGKWKWPKGLSASEVRVLNAIYALAASKPADLQDYIFSAGPDGFSYLDKKGSGPLAKHLSHYARREPEQWRTVGMGAGWTVLNSPSGPHLQYKDKGPAALSELFANPAANADFARNAQALTEIGSTDTFRDIAALSVMRETRRALSRRLGKHGHALGDFVTSERATALVANHVARDPSSLGAQWSDALSKTTQQLPAATKNPTDWQPDERRAIETSVLGHYAAISTVKGVKELLSTPALSSAPRPGNNRKGQTDVAAVAQKISYSWTYEGQGSGERNEEVAKALTASLAPVAFALPQPRSIAKSQLPLPPKTEKKA